MALNCYIDESIRGEYILCVVYVKADQLNTIRHQVKNLRHPNRASIHIQEESKSTQNSIRRQISTISCRAQIFTASTRNQPISVARTTTLRRAVLHSSRLEVNLITLDASNSLLRDRKNINDIAASHNIRVPHYRHMNSRHEPLLWLPDIVAWCYGRGGVWKEAVDPLIDEVIEL